MIEAKVPPPALTSYTDSVKASSQSVQPSRKDFLALAQEHTLVPVCRILAADLETPVSAFLRAAWPERECFMLESVENGEQVGRYTFIGLAPFKRIVARGQEITITEGRKVVQLDGDIFSVLRRALAGHKPARLKGLPPFTAGAVGFFSYDAVRQIERLPERAKDELGVPDACLLFFDEVLAFDHVRKEIWMVVTADVTRGKLAGAYDKAVERLNRLEKRLAQPLPNAIDGPDRRVWRIASCHLATVSHSSASKRPCTARNGPSQLRKSILAVFSFRPGMSGYIVRTPCQPGGMPVRLEE